VQTYQNSPALGFKKRKKKNTGQMGDVRLMKIACEEDTLWP